MARIDKYNPEVGGFRAPLNAAYSAPRVSSKPVGVVVGVSLNTSGRVIVGSGPNNSGLVGVVCLTRDLPAGAVVDVMQHGEVVEFGTGSDGQTAAAAGTNYFAVAATGAMAAGTGTGTETSAGNRKVGWTVEATRLVVRFETANPA
jgi:hypothetical protein